jgi:trehalose 6-phosphate synthase/phosphatase
VEALIFLLDYDGTLVPIVARPELAEPDDEVRALLRSLAAAGAEVHVVSGRGRDVIGAWLGELPVTLHAEHGVWSRAPGEDWRARFAVDPAWMDEGERAMRAAAARLPGALVERKTSSLAWHYRLAEPEAAKAALSRLRAELAPLAEARGLDLLDGACVIELRDARASKGAVTRDVAAAAPPGARIVAFGDDTTDEEMFAALPPDALTIKVGGGATIARDRVADPHAARERMRRLAQALEHSKHDG